MIEQHTIARANALSMERRTSAARHAAVLRAKPTLSTRLRALVRRLAGSAKEGGCGC